MQAISKYNVLHLAKQGAVYADTPLYTQQGKYRRLCTAVTFYLSNETMLVINEGMVWDENSIPYLLQWAFPKSGKYAIPALIHDALYFDTTTSQKFADDEFKLWMKWLKISSFQIWFRYNAVRWFGGRWWKKNINNPGERCITNRKIIKLL